MIEEAKAYKDIKPVLAGKSNFLTKEHVVTMIETIFSRRLFRMSYFEVFWSRCLFRDCCMCLRTKRYRLIEKA